ncbi:MAG: energy transducer TonB [Pyrinomonadaceae bacterium]|nr:energy transducer TonB [Pyrinomonadaceae bacterium]
MLDQLVESNSHTKENARRGSFLLSTFFVVCALFSSGILWSLFAKDFGIGANDLEISTLIAPLSVTKDEPPPPEKEPKKELKAAPNADVRTKIIQAVSESPKETPNKVSVEKSNVPPRNPNNLTVLGRDNTTAANAADYNYKGAVDPNAKGVGDTGGTSDGKVDAVSVKVPPPPPPFVKKETVKIPSDRRISLGVINGKAINLVKPPYPPTARAVHAAGTVNVQVTIDEKGNVIAANAVGGHPLLRQAAENAARASKFNPTLLSNQPVKVSGVIVYKFAAQ